MFGLPLAFRIIFSSVNRFAVLDKLPSSKYKEKIYLINFASSSLIIRRPGLEGSLSSPRIGFPPFANPLNDLEWKFIETLSDVCLRSNCAKFIILKIIISPAGVLVSNCSLTERNFALYFSSSFKRIQKSEILRESLERSVINIKLILPLRRSFNIR
ncbi:MAG: hypothetical protein A2385_00035 [Bdellovibrionales bacterium RIFOXYB1_FULL_39_21]|nr:MAG: hypothetical protein A2385_00035 [Bdellovibrionales bacterium RIFOXYB1_FULL_39_21]